MKEYVFKTVDPYNDGRADIVFKNVPDDFKFCETYQYTNNVKGYDVSFLIFFYAYDEALFNQINSLCTGDEFYHKHTHAYRIKDYMVGSFWSVELLSELPYETIDELNGRFLDVFSNHLIKIEQETMAYRIAERDFYHLSIGIVDDFDKWTDEQKQQWKEASDWLRNTQQYFTVCIRRFIGFSNHTQDLEINTACMWFDEPGNVQKGHSLITRENDQWFMLMDDYNPSIKKRITIDDSPEVWHELRQRQFEVLGLFNNGDVIDTVMQEDDLDELVPTLPDMSGRFTVGDRVKVLVSKVD